jgi:hypothetical protein
MSTSKLSDNDLRSMLYNAGIPAYYHKREAGLRGLQTPNAAAMADWYRENARGWRDQGGCVEIPYDGPGASAEVYYSARALLLVHKIACQVIPRPALASGIIDKTIYATLEDRELLVLMGFSGVSPRPMDQTTTDSLEWFVRRWLDNKGMLLLHGDVRTEVCKWWSTPFISIIKHRTVKRFDGDPV